MVCFTEYHSNACIVCLSCPSFCPWLWMCSFHVANFARLRVFQLSSVIQGYIQQQFLCSHPSWPFIVCLFHSLILSGTHSWTPFSDFFPELLVIILLLSFFFRSFHFSRVVFFSCLFLFSLDLKEKHSLTPLSMSLLKSYKERAREECSMYTKIVCLAHFPLL